MTERKKQHYVPQFYLQGFKITTGQPGMIRAFNKTKGYADRKSGTSIESAAQSLYHYKITRGGIEEKTYVETHILDSLDNRYSKTLQNFLTWIRENKNPKLALPAEYWRDLGGLLYLLHHRTPNARDAINAEHGGDFSQHFELLSTYFEQEAEKFYESFTTRHIFILKAPIKESFITSDDPVIMLPKRQIGELYQSLPDRIHREDRLPIRPFTYSGRTEIVFPLTSRLLLWIPQALPSNDARDSYIWGINTKSLRQINRLIYNHAHEHVYASSMEEINWAQRTKLIPQDRLNSLLKINKHAPRDRALLDILRK